MAASDPGKFVTHKVTPIGQHLSTVCWIACYRMLYQWKKLKDKQCYDRLNSTGVSLTKALDIGDWQKTGAALKLTGYSIASLKSDFEKFYYLVEKCGPLWCAGDFLKKEGHVILVTGVYEKHQEIDIIDPWEVHRGSDVLRREYKWWADCIKEAPWACQMWW